MEYIKGHITIFEQIKNKDTRGICYYGAVDEALLLDADIGRLLSELTQKNMPMEESVSCKITSAKFSPSGEMLERGRYCVFVYPKLCGRLDGIYVQDDESAINILSSWEHKDVYVGSTPYYLYYQTVETKDVDVQYRFDFDDSEVRK